MHAEERRTSELGARLLALGAFDVGPGSSGSVVVIFPGEVTPETIAAAEAEGVIVKSLPLTRADIARFHEVLQAVQLAPGAGEHRYWVGGDFDNGRILLATNAPRAVTESLLEQFPDGITLQGIPGDAPFRRQSRRPGLPSN